MAEMENHLLKKIEGNRNEGHLGQVRQSWQYNGIKECNEEYGDPVEFQYTNRIFRHMLEEAGMTQSMSRVAHCIDNGPMEGFWGILKRERYYGKRFTSKQELVEMIRDYIYYYNTQRVPRNLGVVTPLEKYQMAFAA